MMGNLVMNIVSSVASSAVSSAVFTESVVPGGMTTEEKIAMANTYSNMTGDVGISVGVIVIVIFAVIFAGGFLVSLCQCRQAPVPLSTEDQLIATINNPAATFSEKQKAVSTLKAMKLWEYAKEKLKLDTAFIAALEAMAEDADEADEADTKRAAGNNTNQSASQAVRSYNSQ